MIRQNGIPDCNVAGSPFAKSHLAPVSEAACHVFFDPNSFVMLVVECWYSRHPDRTLSVPAPYSFERVGVKIGPMGRRGGALRLQRVGTIGLQLQRGYLELNCGAAGA